METTMNRRIKSNFKRNEAFDIETIPKHFESVTNESIHSIKHYCAKVISNKYHGEYQPSSLKSMLETIFGEFDSVYAVVEGDYQTRKMNLQLAEQSGLGNIQADLISFKNQVDDHHQLFERYQEISLKVTGHKISEKLKYSDEKMKDLENSVEKLIKGAA